jgi:hypothetical protein
MNTEATTGEYMLLFRGTQWDKGLSPQELQQVMDKVMAWAEGLQGQGKARVGQPLGAQGRIVSGKKGGFVADGPFAESKEAIGGYLVLRADDLNNAVEIARSNPMLEYGATIEVRPVLAECPVFQRARVRAGRADQLLSEAVA